MTDAPHPDEPLAPACCPRLWRVVQAGPALFVASVLLLLAAAWLRSELLGLMGGAVCGFSFFLLAVRIARGLLFEVQWPLLEFLITVVAGSLPLAFLARSNEIPQGEGAWMLLALILVAGELISATCTLIGLSLARLLNAGGMWARLGLIAMAWLALLGAGCLATAALVSMGMNVGGIAEESHGYLGLLWAGAGLGAVQWSALIVLERRARRSKREAQEREASALPARLDLPRHAG